jgi:hypothetical protein
VQAGGTFLLTLDTELIWGSFDHSTPSQFERRYPDVRCAIDELLEILVRHRISATWAVVGHLFLNRCERDSSGRCHPEISRKAGLPDRFQMDPCASRETDPLWYGDDIVASLRAASWPQEIGCHSFSHVLFSQEQADDGVIASELAACRVLAKDVGLELTSFVFPRNQVGFVNQLSGSGFTAYRGVDPMWFRRLPRLLARPAHLVDQALGLPPPLVEPSERLPGLWNIPGSMVILPRLGIRKLVPVASQLRKARNGLHRAARAGKAFHLWTHPFTLASDRTVMLGILREVVAEADRLREQGSLRVLTMRQFAAEARSDAHLSGPVTVV